ncbi:hypothetical protein SNOG_03919 [Parastagonospora nodorum SN15]|uniref:T6SS Phospholipase effector Tle1-like catalytic domain-containing protein n=1 Tax=Phaeosphaeria nodorum (strain SN15 / ATCC MYA-4574 / FGSC 10173) TaxID=321614 RepID=Q0UWE5_PHANO|nr:hypothetical protein SNOG_03919 [Parastagonospora nodorum SN15]EAT89124.2 hypothetical protein SNOG_03919 [Parastagonospora nodorum SN15]
MDYGAAPKATHVRKKFVLCFDGTGNKFSGTDSDSNILKIYRMLDRNGDDQFHYYQPGDDIFFFGFSRGAYTARFLAEMLDHVGLLSADDSMAGWQRGNVSICLECRLPEEIDRKTAPGKKTEKTRLLEFMCAFRETFSRPVRPIRFLGLFDTVNSVPAFENAWMQRSKFPYTARSSARVIRHAVSIDERRAKFRQDLISQEKPDKSLIYKRHHKRKHAKQLLQGASHIEANEKIEEERGRRDTLAPPERFRDPHETAGIRSRSADYSQYDGSIRSPAESMMSFGAHETWASDDVEGEQDIQEVWFPGCHADIGGGWPLDAGHDAALSHVPLVWMVREAQKAGLDFDEEKLEALHCWYDDDEYLGTQPQTDVPIIEVDPGSPPPTSDVNDDTGSNGIMVGAGAKDFIDEENFASHHSPHAPPADTEFHKHFHFAATKGRIHDVLQFKNGASGASVISWNIMEYMPFRRMDLREDGTWKAIIWPLPKGETRDIPANAVIHSSVIKRMLADPQYRPGNLLIKE